MFWAIQMSPVSNFFSKSDLSVEREVPHIHDADNLGLKWLQDHHESVEEDGGGCGELGIEVIPRELSEEDDVWNPHHLLIQVHPHYVVVSVWQPVDKLVHPAKQTSIYNDDS